MSPDCARYAKKTATPASPAASDAETLGVELNVLAEKGAEIPPRFRDSRYVFLANTHPALQRAAIDALPDSQREVITLRDVEGWTSEEVCNVLEITETNQRVLLHRARSKVRALVEERMGRDRA